jgi:hypothetical protein
VTTAETHAMGVELQLVELVERQRSAEAAGREAEVTSLQGEIDALHAELAEIGDSAAAAS